MSGARPAPWRRLRVRVAWAEHEAVENALLEAEALSVSIEDADDSAVSTVEEWTDADPGWRRVWVDALFDATTELSHARSAALAAGAEADSVAIADVADQDWVRQSRSALVPRRVGENLWVCPHGMSAPEPAACTVFLDPGLAFGTGEHATTALCLDRLSRMDLSGLSVLDYGCGSGILAVAALKLGAVDGWGVDIDPRALEVSEDNARFNGVGERYGASLPSQLPHDRRFDVVCANILAGALIRLYPTLDAVISPDGTLLLSGILADQAPQVAAVYGEQFDLATAERDGWVVLYGRRRSTERSPAEGLAASC